MDIWNGNHKTNEEINKLWTVDHTENNAIAMWFRGGNIPKVLEVFKLCDKEAQYPLRLVKDEAG